MPKPIILAVDDEPEVLNAIERDLRHHFSTAYRVMKARSGDQALEATRQLKQRGAAVALFLVDERMPGMSGTEFLVEALKLYPDSRRVLLTAYADTQTSITGINAVGLDYYLIKPWEPPQERLYPALDDLLLDWLARVRPPFDGLRVAGTALSASSYAVKDFLSRNQVPYQWVDLETDAATRELILSMPEGMSRLPVLLFADGTTMVQPTARELADRLGMQTHATGTTTFYDFIVVGGGPAGLAAAVYGASEGLRTLLIERHATGGQAGTSSRIENYLGFPTGVAGDDLGNRALQQAKRFGAEIIVAREVVGIAADPTRSQRAIQLDGDNSIETQTIIVANGVSWRKLEVVGAEALGGRGIYYGAARTEAAGTRGLDIFLIGGGNSAGQAAMFFADYARTVTILIRGPSLSASMSHYLIEQLTRKANVNVEALSQVVALEGTDHLEAIIIEDRRSGMR